MKGLLKADLYRVSKSKLTLIVLILAVAFPVVMTLLYAGLRALTEIAAADPQFGETDPLGIFTANSLMSGAYSLSNNLGIVIPVFAGIFICQDISNGTLRNKIIAGGRRSSVYGSHLIVSMLFNVLVITVYVLTTSGLALLFFPYRTAPGANVLKDILYWVIDGTMTYIFIATVSTFFAFTMRSTAPTIIFTVVTAVGLNLITSVISLMDYEKIRYLVYLIPTFTSSYFSLEGMNFGTIFSFTVAESKEILLLEGLLGYLVFGALHTVLGLLIFKRKDIQ